MNEPTFIRACVACGRALVEDASTHERRGFSLDCPLPDCETWEQHLEHVGRLDVIEDAVEDVDAWEADRG